MKYKLGVKYYMVNKGWIETVVFRSVRITVDLGAIYSEEVYYDENAKEIVIVDNQDTQTQTRPIFKSEKQAIDYQIRVLKALKHKEPCEHEGDGRPHNVERLAGSSWPISNKKCIKCGEFFV